MTRAGEPRTLTRAEAQRFYNRMGAKQDTQWFYEDPATRALVAHAAFDKATAVFELGCGTGRFGAELLATHLPPAATYLGCDLSATMVDLARARLAPFGARAQVRQTTGSPTVEVADASFDRVVSNYVLDLLSRADAISFVAEARRLLVPEGRLCLVSLTHGTTALSRGVTALWKCIYRLRPNLVGGCRPIELLDAVAPPEWRIEYRAVVVAFGVPSEVLVARPS
jgi:ubiquinone/menaquinone biosynthesis C-methylase UbiE